jgi:translocation and assembly module TamB
VGLLLVGALLLGLQTEMGATAAAQWLAATANPLSGTELTVERASGSWVRSLRLTGLTLTRTDSSTGTTVQMARIDTLAASYRLLPLLQGRLHLEAVAVTSPEVTMRQAADSTWDWIRVLPEPAEEADTSAAMPIRVDRVRITGGNFAASFYAGGRDSTAHVRALRLLARDLESASAVTGRLDTLGLRAQLPNDTTDLRLAARGALSSTAFTLDTLQLDSPRSRVRGQGRVRLPEGPTDPVDDVALRVQADPFALRDLTPFAPTLAVDPAETLRLDLRVTGSGRRLSATADGQFSGGGTLAVEAEATPTTTTTDEGPPLHYHLDAEIRDLTTSLLGPPDTTQNRLSATATADLTGRSLAALDGTADLRVSDTRWSPLRIPDMTMTTTWREGLADIDVRGMLNDAQVDVTGQTRPLADAPDATLTARVQALNVAAFAPGAGIESRLAASTQVQARALGAETQEIEVSLTLDSSRVGVQQIDGGQAALGLGPERTTFEGALSLPVGRVQAAGFAVLDGSEQFALESARLDSFNVAALTGDTTESRVTGTARLEGRGFAPETMRLDASVTLENSYYGPYQLSALTTTATLTEGQLTTATEATLNGGEWTLGLRGRPFAPTPSFNVREGRFRNVDLGPLLQSPSQSSRLDGTLRGTVRGLDPTTMTADAGLTLDSSRVNQQQIDAASLTLQLQNAELQTDVSLDTPDGGTQLTATAHPFNDTPTFRVTEGSFRNLNVGTLAGVPNLTTALSGALALEGRGLTASTLALDAGLSFSESRINDATLSEGQLSVTTEQGRATTEGQFAVAEGQVALSGTIDSLDATPTYAIRTTVDSLNAGALAGLDTLSARIGSLRWTLDGRGADPRTLTTSTRLSATGLHVDRFSIDALDLNGSFRRGQLALDTLVARSNAFTSRGEGTLAVLDTSASSDFLLRTEVSDPSPLRRLVDANTLRLQTGILETRIYGRTLAEQRFDGEIELRGLLYDDVRLAEGEINFNGQRGEEQLFRRLEVDGTLGYLSVPSLSAERTRVDAVYDGTTVALSSNVRLDPTHSASLSGTVTPGADQTEVTLTQLDLRFEDDRWSLLQDATITVGDQYRVGGLLLHSGPQQIAVDGTVDFDGTQNLLATIEGVQMGSISSLAGLSGLDGTLSGSLDLTGPATAPRLDSRLALDLRSEDRAVGTLRLNANYRDLALSLDAALAHTDGSTLTAEGTIPTDLRLQAPDSVDVADRPVRLSLRTGRFPVNWVDPFLDPATVRDVSGILAADVAVRGTLSDPDLAGTASLSDGAASLPALETRYRDASATLRFADDRVQLDTAVVRSVNNGRLQAEGVINFPQLTVGEYDLTLNASNFVAIDTRAYRRAVIDGTLSLQGTTQKPTLAGTVQVQSADIYYNEVMAESDALATTVPLTEEDQLTLENRFGLRLSAADTTTFDAYEAMEMDLTVQIRRNTWIRSKSAPEMNIQFMGDLDVSKAPNADPQVFGSIEVISERSTIRQFGQEFQIQEGTLTFNGDPYTPYLTLEAVYEQRARGAQGNEVTITLRLEGRPDTLTPTLSSTPPMDTRNILSYLATGRPADELLSGGGEGNLAAQVALGQASNFVENLAASELGLDVVRVQIRPSGASYLTVGRYFTPRFFVSVEQPVTEPSVSGAGPTPYLPDLTLEYQLLDTLMLRALNNQASFQVDLLFEYAY